MFVDELPDMPRIQGFHLVKGHPQLKYLEIGMFKEFWLLQVKVPKSSSGPTKVYVATNTAKVAPKKVGKPTTTSASPAPPQTSAPRTTNVPEKDSNHVEAEGFSIYIRNLPFNVTPAQLETEFKKFGPIKQGGIQVRNNRQQGYCFGFVEFLSASSMNDAIQVPWMQVSRSRSVLLMVEPSIFGVPIGLGIRRSSRGRLTKVVSLDKSGSESVSSHSSMTVSFSALEFSRPRLAQSDEE